MPLIFKPNTERFANGVRALSGAIPIGTVYWDAVRSRGAADPVHYRWVLMLPGRRREGRSVTEEEGRAALQAAFDDWCRKARLVPAPDTTNQ